MQNNKEIVIFETEDKQVKLPVAVDNETVWQTQAQMVELFKGMFQSFPVISGMCLKKMKQKKKAICIFCKFQLQINR